MSSLAAALSQTFRSLPNLSDRFSSFSMEDWWQDYVFQLEHSGYRGNTQLAFFIALFSVLGRMARVDGRIRPAELELNRKVMDQLKLSLPQQQLANRLFSSGAQADFNLDQVLGRFNRLCSHRASMLQIFVEVQLQMALADGEMESSEQELLNKICKRLDISPAIFNRIEKRVRVTKPADGPQTQSKKTAKAMSLASACDLLEVSRWDSEQAITQAYRRQLSIHHPDKMMARGCNDDEVQAAMVQLQEIKRAYEIVSKAKKIR
ncbi:MAG: co-chaperone DjlA [Gammaproteobacteria bacterium]|nr:co-chaperone DjlA [Gammaproteobacteria bacterium]